MTYLIELDSEDLAFLLAQRRGRDMFIAPVHSPTHSMADDSKFVTHKYQTSCHGIPSQVCPADSSTISGGRSENRARSNKRLAITACRPQPVSTPPQNSPASPSTRRSVRRRR